MEEILIEDECTYPLKGNIRGSDLKKVIKFIRDDTHINITQDNKNDSTLLEDDLEDERTYSLKGNVDGYDLRKIIKLMKTETNLKITKEDFDDSTQIPCETDD